MRLLLDTHALLWWLADDPALSATARKLIGRPNNTVLVSAASAWEIGTKVRLGKLPGAEEDLRQTSREFLSESVSSSWQYRSNTEFELGAYLVRIETHSIACWPPRARRKIYRW